MLTSELKAYRARKDFSQNFMAKKLGVSKPTYSRKERGLIPFKDREIATLIEILDLGASDVMNIFFNNEVALKTTKAI